MGCAQTLSLIRQKFWIPQGRAAVNRILKRCAVCRRHEGGPYKMPPISTERVSESAPFTYVGVDYFGPLFMTVNRQTQKVWVCLYTCFATRTIHLELMNDMTTQQFLLGFRRVIVRHGKPNKIYFRQCGPIQACFGHFKQVMRTDSYRERHSVICCQ